MFFRLKYRLAIRFVRSRRNGSLTRFISFASTCGIAIGVFAAIVGLSSMNGFEYELEHRVLSVLPMAELSSSEPYFKDDKSIIETLHEDSNILGTSPAIKQRAIITANRSFAPLIIAGLSLDSIKNVIRIDRFSSINLNCLSNSGVVEQTNVGKASAPSFFDSIANEGLTLESLGVSSKRAKTSGKCDIDSIIDKHFAQNPNYTKNNKELADSSKLSDQDIANIANQNVASAEDLTLAKNIEALPRIILGSGLAKRLKVKVGDIVDVITLNSYQEQSPNPSASDKGVKDADNSKMATAAKINEGLSQKMLSSLKKPDRKKALVIGLIDVGGQLDTTVALMDINVLKKMTSLQGPNSIYVKTKDLHRVKEMVLKASQGKIKESAYLVTWMNSQGKLYKDIQMVRQIMFIAMFLVLAVSCFNIVSNLMMMVSEKRREIAVLLTMGMQPQQVITTFSLMGVIFGARGTFMGLILGIIVSLIVTPVTLSFKEWFGFDLLNKEVYFVNFIPCRLELMDVLMVIGISLVMSLFAALYPAIKASRVMPSRELNI